MKPRIAVLLAFALGFLGVRLLGYLGAPHWTIWLGPLLCLIAVSLQLLRRGRAWSGKGI